jgi:hypothetical protein
MSYYSHIYRRKQVAKIIMSLTYYLFPDYSIREKYDIFIHVKGLMEYSAVVFYDNFIPERRLFFGKKTNLLKINDTNSWFIVRQYLLIDKFSQIIKIS